MKKALIWICLITLTGAVTAQGNTNPPSIRDLDFLIGTWEVREDNREKGWWEESTRKGSFILDSTYIKLSATAVTSSGNGFHV